MKNKIIKIAKPVIGIITGLVIIMTAYLLVANIVSLKTEKPVRVFGYSYSYVPTNSMEPTIKVGDTIIFKKCDYSSLKVGEVIIYRSENSSTYGMYIVHRIVGETSEGFIMQGDNNPSVDPEIVTESMVMGKYVRVFNFLNLGKLASNKNAIYGLLILFFIAIIIMESFNIVITHNKNKLKEENEDLKAEVLEEMREEILKELLEEQNKDK